MFRLLIQTAEDGDFLHYVRFDVFIIVNIKCCLLGRTTLASLHRRQSLVVPITFGTPNEVHLFLTEESYVF